MLGKLTINLKALKENYKILCDQVSSECEVGASVKADAYGLGIDKVALALYETGCRNFFVATLDEALHLRQLLPTPDIYVLNGLEQGREEVYSKETILPVLNSMEQVSRCPPLTAALMFETGMNRLGISVKHTKQILEDPGLIDHINVTHIMSHFASADMPESPLTIEQYERFSVIAKHFPKAQKSLSNSFGIFVSNAYHFDCVRPGMAIYGLNPTPYKNENPMNPVVSLEIPVLQVREVKKSEAIGYGETYRFEDDAVTATLAGGYADGIKRVLGNKANLFWKGEACPVRGRISMDLTTVELTHLPENERPKPGDYLELIGPNQSADALADMAGTIGYEIFTSLGDRFNRLYVD